MQLRRGVLSWLNVAGLGVAIAISGQFSGWNFGLAAGGWGGMVAAAGLMAVFYLGYAQCVSELAAAMPSAGGFETYCRRAFGVSAGYVVGMSVLLALALAIGVVANFTAAYGTSVLGVQAVFVKIVLFAVVLGLQLRGVREAVGVTMVVGITAVLVLALFALSMAPFARVANLASYEGAGGLLPHGAFGIFAAIPYALWMFLGVEQAALAAEEAIDPARTMPRALTIAVLSLFVVGLGVLMTGPSGAGTDPLSRVQDPLYAALTSPLAFGRENWLTRIIGLGALVGMIATFFSIVYASSRQLFSLGRDGYLPMLVAATDRQQTPAAALYIVVGVGVVASLFPPEKLILPIVFLFNVTYLFALAAFIRLRRQHPELERPYRAVGGVLTAVVTALLSLVVLAACFVQESRGLLYALVIYAVLIVQFVLVRRRGMLESRERS